MQKFSSDLDSRVRSFPSLRNAPLIPVVEAVWNAYDAIAERTWKEPESGPGTIQIDILRDPQAVLPGIEILPDIRGFRVTDSGVGFTDARMDAFLTIDNTQRPCPGARGAGRLAWLKGYGSVEIVSTYNGPDDRRLRTFRIASETEFVDTAPKSAGHDAEPGTAVTLLHPKGSCRPAGTLEQIAEELAGRLFAELAVPGGPVVTIADSGRVLTLRDLLDCTESELSVMGESICMCHMRSALPGLRNTLYLDAGTRRVLSVDLARRVPELDPALYGSTGYHYQGVVTGAYLDRHVSPDGTSFEIPAAEHPDSPPTGLPSVLDIINACLPEITAYLGSDLEAVRNARGTRLETVLLEHPRLQLLERQKPEVLGSVRPNDSAAAIEKKLRDAQAGYLETVNIRVHKQLQKLASDKMRPERSRELMRQCARQTAQAAACSEAEYAGHRRILLDLLQRAVQDPELRIERDSAMIGLLLPVHPERPDVPSDMHNLWTVDERLRYDAFLTAAPTPAQAEPGGTSFVGRPLAWGERQREVHGTMKIVELLQTDRDDYTFGSNPIDDMLSFVRVLAKGESMDARNNPIVLKQHAQLFLYAICDITPSLRDVLELYGYFVPSADGLGFSGYNQEAHAYIEIISPEKLLEDAARRNRALFERLGLRTPASR